MYSYPRASMTFSTLNQIAGDTGLIGVFFPAATNGDNKPRLITTAAQALTLFGFGIGPAFIAWFMKKTKRPVIALPMAVTTASTITPVVLAGLTSTSVVTCAATSTGSCAMATHGIVRVKRGGTVGTAQIVLEVSLDGGEKFKDLRLGKASSIVVPYYGLTIAAAAGILTDGEKVCEWNSTAPVADVDDVALCMAELAKTKYQVRTLIHLDPIILEASATTIVGEINDYADLVGRDTIIRLNARLMTAGEDPAVYAAAIADLFEDVTGEFRVDMAFDGAYIECPITKYFHVRPTQWAVVVEEYNRDLGVATWDASKGPLDEVSLEGPTTETLRYDERETKQACPNRFTSLCTDANENAGTGVYVAMSLTREVDDNILGLTHNVLVANLCATLGRRATFKFKGTTPQVNADGTPTKKTCAAYESAVNAWLKKGLKVGQAGEIAQATSWKADPLSVLKGPGSKLLGLLTLMVHGTVIEIETTMVVG